MKENANERTSRERNLTLVHIDHLRNILELLSTREILISTKELGFDILEYPLTLEDNEYIRNVLKDHYTQKIKELEERFRRYEQGKEGKETA